MPTYVIRCTALVTKGPVVEAEEAERSFVCHSPEPEPCGHEQEVMKPASWVDEVGGAPFREFCTSCGRQTDHVKVFTPTALINPSGGMRPMDDGDAESMLRHKKDLEQKMREGKVTNLRLPKNRRKEFDPEYQPSTY